MIKYKILHKYTRHGKRFYQNLDLYTFNNDFHCALTVKTANNLFPSEINCYFTKNL